MPSCKGIGFIFTFFVVVFSTEQYRLLGKF